MTIAPTASPSSPSSPQPVRSAGGIALQTDTTQETNETTVASTIVDLSALGQLLATTDLLQIGQQDLPEILALAEQSGLNMLDAGLPLLFGSGNSSLSLADIFALEVFNPGTGMTLAQQLTALDQYNLVSMLLG